MAYNKFTFKCEQEDDDYYFLTTSSEFSEDILDDVVLRFEEFLRGCGYVFDSLNLVNKKIEGIADDTPYDFDQCTDIFLTDSPYGEVNLQNIDLEYQVGCGGCKCGKKGCC